jgi:thymidylate kinase
VFFQEFLLKMVKKGNRRNGNSNMISEIKTISFMGTPGAGKSKQISLLQQRLEEELTLRGTIFDNGIWKARYLKGERGSREIFNAGYLIPLITAAAEKTLRYRSTEMDHPDYIVMERNSRDFEAMTKTLENLGKIDEGEYEKKYRNLIESLVSLDNLVVMMTVSPEVAMKRETKRAGAERVGDVMNIPFLTRLNLEYERIKTNLQYSVDSFLEINGEGDLESNSNLIYNAACKLFSPANYTKQELEQMEIA